MVPPLQVSSHGSSDSGCRRSRNEDRIFFDDALGLYVVCDGVGGRRHGALAAEIAVGSVRESVDATAGSPEGTASRLLAAVKLANHRVWRRSEESLEFLGMGATVAAVLMEGAIAAVANVGDSRVYLWRDGGLEQLSVDDVASRNLRSVLTRAAGWEADVEVHLAEWALAAGDGLLLCSDGLYGQVPGERLAQIAGAGGAVDARVTSLIAAAHAAGAPDNVSAVLVEYRAEAEAVCTPSGILL